MHSLRLFHDLTKARYASANPVFFRQRQRHPDWLGRLGWFTRRSGLVLALGGLACYIVAVASLYVANPLLLALPLLLVWMLLVSASVGPALVEEREHRTWEVLRATPLHLEMVVLGKAGGALWWLRHGMRILAGVIVFAAAIIVVVSMTTMAQPYATYDGRATLLTACGMVVFAPFGIAVVFVFDRLQQFTLLVVSMLAVSASTRSVRVSVTGGIALMLLLWGMDAGIATLVIALSGERALTEMGNFSASMATLGPSVGYLARLPLEAALPVIGVTLVVREAIIWVMWRWTLRAAEAV